ncbi:P-loop containing nucleoside triphosphate hydrolase protein [Lasiosphaeria hispida]|uniref:Gluconokinase n=1 Tax=Lasiosphaeria hispida TaxID=260671 RepID=A0AAJ0HJU2_9PEZI|nr:P-loop containing nucleoside triphosphate hydrolase protein [Lasiosphaeria hispida]
MGSIPTSNNTASPAPEQQAIGDTAQTDKHRGHRWIWFVTGPTACGKTTIAQALADDVDFTFIEGDDFHPQASVEKMSHGLPLTDADRAGWLAALRSHETAQPAGSARGAKLPHLVMTCSALKQGYRDVLREGGAHAGDLRIRFVLLDASEAELVRRAAGREGHFAGPELVRSQMAALERPGEGEADVVVVDTEGRGVGDTVREVVTRVREGMMMDDGSYLKVL